MKKIVSFLLSAVLLLSLLPITAFATNEGDFSLVGGAVTVDGTSDKVISVAFQAADEMTVVGIEGIFSKGETEKTEYLELTKLVPPEGVTLGSYDTNSIMSGKILWADDVFTGYQVRKNGAIWTAQYTVAKDTPSGTYQVQFALTDLVDKTYESVLSGKTYTANIVVTNNSNNLTSGYTASIATSDKEVNVGETVSVQVNVAGKNQTNFAAAEVKISYDADKLTYESEKSTLNGAKVDAKNGVLTLEDYGEDQSFGTAYTIVFTAKTKGNTTVKLESAAFSDKVDAQKYDLIPATISNQTVAFTLKQTHAVTLPDIFKGSTSVEDGQDYTFFLANDADFYDYSTVTATMNNAGVDVVNNGDGSYTVKNVTGSLSISATRAGKTYDVTLTGSAKDDVTLPESKPQYGVDYTFTLPTISGFNLTLAGITYEANGSKVAFERTGNTVKILGTNITGNFTITVNKESAPTTTASVTVEGNAASDVTAKTTATPNVNFTFTVTENENYTYTVSAKVNDSSVEVSGGNGSYTIAAEKFKAGDSIVITVNKSVKTEKVSLSSYLTLNNKQMYLITISTDKLNGSVFTYKGEKMFWSEKYNAYCYLMISAEAAPQVSANDLAIIQGDAGFVAYGMDVNISGKVDANDAQLVYNMYQAQYDSFTDSVTVEKLLRADVNGDKCVNVEDAAAIIAEIFKK